MEAGRFCRPAAREQSGGDTAQHEVWTRVEPPAQDECEQAAEQAEEGQARARAEIVVLAGRRLTLALVWRAGAMDVCAVHVPVVSANDRQGRRGTRPVRQLVAGEPVHGEDREDGEKHGKKGQQGSGIEPMRALPTRDHASGL